MILNNMNETGIIEINLSGIDESSFLLASSDSDRLYHLKKIIQSKPPNDTSMVLL